MSRAREVLASQVNAVSMEWSICPAEELSTHADTWNRLVDRSGYPPFVRAEFLIPALKIFGNQRCRMALGYLESELAVAAIVQHIALGRWAVFQPSQLPLGAWVMSRAAGWSTVLPSLLRALPGLALMITVTQQDPRLVERPDDTARLEVVDYVRTAWVDVKGSFEEFWQARGRNLRQNVAKQRRKIENAGQRLEFQFIDDPSRMASALAEFARLESSGWKGAEGTAVRLDNDQGRFYQEVLSAFSARGDAFAMCLSLDDRPIAVDFGIRDRDCAVILKTTYDEELKGISPGQLLHERAFAFFFEQQQPRRIEFYGKVMEWHTRWTEQSCVLYHVNYFRSPAIRSARTLVKRMRGAKVL